MADKKDYADVLLEDINSKFDAVIEATSGMQDSVKKIPRMSERLEKMESDMSLIKLATKLTSDDTKLIKIRTEKLEDMMSDMNDLQQRVESLESA